MGFVQLANGSSPGADRGRLGPTYFGSWLTSSPAFFLLQPLGVKRKPIYFNGFLKLFLFSLEFGI